MIKNKKGWLVFTVMCLALVRFDYLFAVDQSLQKLYVGWATKSITPDKPVALDGQFETRISKEILDSVTCTALAIETRAGQKSIETGIMISCDLVVISEDIAEKVKVLLKKELPAFDLNKLVLNATHTHTGPVSYDSGWYKIPKNVMQPSEYAEFAASRIVRAAVEAWNARKPAGMSWGLGQAVIGHNRRAVYFEPVPSGFGKGTAVMYGDTDRKDFSHIEGYEDHGVEMMFFWDEQKKLTGMVLNVASTSQETENLSAFSRFLA